MVCAIGGALAAGRKGLDLLGVLVVSFTAAVGGGTLRDLLLDRNPVFWLTDTWCLWASLIAGCSAWICTRRIRVPKGVFNIVDAFGLALFSMSGIRIALDAGQTPTISLIMGTITGVAGGVLRDLLCGEIPWVFRPTEFYASASLLGGAFYFAAIGLGSPVTFATILGAAAIVFIRLAALKWSWRLPVFLLSQEEGRKQPSKIEKTQQNS